MPLKVELTNKGACPWIPDVGHRLVLEGDAKRLGLPESVDFAGEWVLPGDKRTFTLSGTAPTQRGAGELKIGFIAPYRDTWAFIDQKVKMEWR